MFDIDVKAYKVLMRLYNVKDSRNFKPSHAYWLSYLINRGLAQNEYIKTEENENLGVVVITPKGRSLIKEKYKQEFKVWVFWLIPIIISVAALIIAILK